MKEPVKPPEANWIELGKDEHGYTQWAKVTQHLPNSVMVAYADGSNVVQDYMIYDGKHWSIQGVSSLGRNIGGSKSHLYKLLRQGPRLDYASTEPPPVYLPEEGIVWLRSRQGGLHSAW